MKDNRFFRFCVFVVIMFFLSACTNAKGIEMEHKDLEISSETEGSIEIAEEYVDNDKADGISKDIEVIENEKDTYVGFSPVVMNIGEGLLLVPTKEDIPESIMKVFTEKAEFEVVFDKGFNIHLYDNETEVQIEVDYYDGVSEWNEINHIKTNIDRYDFGGPYYSGESNYPLYWYAYKVIDLDADGTNEIIYKVKTDEKITTVVNYMVIFHDIGGRVYAYALYPTFLCEDGTVSVPGGGMTCLYRFKSFDEEQYYINCIGYADFSGPEAIYACKGKYVTWEEFNAFYNEIFGDKKQAVFKSIDGLIE